MRVFCLLLLSGCAALFGWDIHAPGVLSEEFLTEVKSTGGRMALYLPPELADFVSRDKGGRFADPQTYHVGEALAPMLVEAFQSRWEEFVLFEVEPTPAMMSRYGLPFLAVVRVADFGNRVTMKGQALELVTQTSIYDSALRPVQTFQARGSSAARRVFAKKGGPEVNLNAAIEQNILAILRHLSDTLPGAAQ